MNTKMPEHLRFTPKEIDIENDYFDNLENKCKSELEDVHNEVAYPIEKMKVGYQKLKGFFLDNMKCFDEYVKAFKSDEYVRTIRLPKISERIMNIKNQLNELA